VKLIQEGNSLCNREFWRNVLARLVAGLILTVVGGIVSAIVFSMIAGE
jgi:hypothetical protein